MAPNKRQAIIWTNANLIHWRIYSALAEDKLTTYMESYLDYQYNPMEKVIELQLTQAPK